MCGCISSEDERVWQQRWVSHEIVVVCFAVLYRIGVASNLPTLFRFNKLHFELKQCLIPHIYLGLSEFNPPEIQSQTLKFLRSTHLLSSFIYPHLSLYFIALM